MEFMTKKYFRMQKELMVGSELKSFRVIPSVYSSLSVASICFCMLLKQNYDESEEEIHTHIFKRTWNGT